MLATGDGAECVVVDPGMDSGDGIARIVEKYRLRPAAVLLTHGHLDHTWSAAALADEYGIPAFIHPDDRWLLTDPLAGISPQTRMMMSTVAAREVPREEPRDVREIADGVDLDIVGLRIGVTHVPGHTPGSVVFGCPGDGAMPALLFSGDFLFAGSIGRTDLPGGDHRAMMKSLARVVLALAPETLVLPGHGSQTTIGQERATNPFVAELTPEGPGR